MLVGTWAIRFYERHGFALVSPARKTVLLKSYWSIPERQIETSVVLANPPEVAARSFSPLVGRRSGCGGVAALFSLQAGPHRSLRSRPPDQVRGRVLSPRAGRGDDAASQRALPMMR